MNRLAWMSLKITKRDGVKSVIPHGVPHCIGEVTCFTCQTSPKDVKSKTKGNQPRVEVFLKSKTLCTANIVFQIRKNAISQAVSEATMKPLPQVHFIGLHCV